jgi:hypothetical protein
MRFTGRRSGTGLLVLNSFEYQLPRRWRKIRGNEATPRVQVVLPRFISNANLSEALGSEIGNGNIDFPTLK